MKNDITESANIVKKNYIFQESKKNLIESLCFDIHREFLAFGYNLLNQLLTGDFAIRWKSQNATNNKKRGNKQF